MEGVKMGREIIKQPNGQFAIFDHTSDVLIAANCSEEEIVERWGLAAKYWAEQEAKDLIRDTKNGLAKKMGWSTLTFLQALKLHVKHEINCGHREDGKWVVNENFN